MRLLISTIALAAALTASGNINFYSNAPEIEVTYQGNAGMKMICIDCCGNVDTLHAAAFEEKPCHYIFKNLPQAKFHKHGNEYRISLPPEAEIIKISIPVSSELVFIPDDTETLPAFDMPFGNRPTMIPVTQRREPDNYEWMERHRAIVAEASARKPRAVILGNSITHFWGGVPGCKHINGAKSWDAVMEPAGFMNMGCGWDRIENVLWRVYHGELDGFEAEKIVLMIGTNNMGISSDDDIVEGLRFLIASIRERQKKADITVIGILPRRGHEEWVRTINPRIATMTQESGCSFVDVGDLLVLPDGKVDETLFTDGLHPNELGYGRIARSICGKNGDF